MRQDGMAGRQDDCVTILLSTYNGAAFLSAQLDSFLVQTHQNWVLYWRDDGSCDETVAMMHAFAAKVGPQRHGLIAGAIIAPIKHPVLMRLH